MTHKSLSIVGTLTLYQRFGTKECVLSHKPPEESNAWVALEEFPAMINSGQAKKENYQTNYWYTL